MKVFGVNFLIFSTLFIGVYLFATNRGAPGFSDLDMPIMYAISGGGVAILFFSFWMTMILHCFRNNKVNNKIIWFLGMIFLPWVMLIVYFFMVYLKTQKGSSIKQ